MSEVRHVTWSLPGGRVDFAISAQSDRGKVRRVNEDSFIAEPPLFAVADGMGGHAFGDRASQTAASALLQGTVGATPTSPQKVLDAVSRANEDVRQISEDEFAGTTIAGVGLVETDDLGSWYWMVFNIGDSRVYSWDGSTLDQVSVDHSAVQELLDEGLVSPEEIRNHPERNVVTRAIGLESVPNPDVWLLPAGGTHTFMVCSDGLTKELDDAAIAACLAASSVQDSDSTPADRLVAAALESGGGDNVTVIVVQATVAIDAAPGDVDGASAAHLEDTLPRSGGIRA